MKLLVAVLFFCLAGCSGMTIEERFQLANECGLGPECQELWDDWNRAEERRIKRKKREEECPVNAVCISGEEWQRMQPY